MRSILCLCSLTIFLFITAGCNGGDESDLHGRNGEISYNVLEKVDLGADWNCRRPEPCIGDYLRFLEHAGPYADPISAEDLAQQIQDVEDGLVDVIEDPIEGEVLKDRILDLLNIGFLYKGIHGRLLQVTTIQVNETPEYNEKVLLFEDPYVGQFKGILLTPKDGEGPFPGMIAIHGHRDDARVYLRRYHGKEYPSHGYVILMLTMRAMGIEICEHITSHLLLLDGFTLIGLRVYETLLGLKYLQYLREVMNDRIGLIGHSGGSSTGNLTVRIEKGFKAYVSDHTVDYCDASTFFELYHCETIPALYPYHLLVNDFQTSVLPIKDVPYGYTNGMEEIFRFFDDHLKGRF